MLEVRPSDSAYDTAHNMAAEMLAGPDEPIELVLHKEGERLVPPLDLQPRLRRGALTGADHRGRRVE